MRCRLVGVAFLMGTFFLLCAPSAGWGQRKGGGGFNTDPGALFDLMAKGRPYVLVSEFNFFRKEMQEFATANNISNGQVSREQYLAFVEQRKTKGNGGMGGFKGGFRPGGFQPPGGFQTPGDMKKEVAVITLPGGGAAAFNPTDSIIHWAESDFKRRDANLDNVLNTDEMPSTLKDDLEKWDDNKDGVIDLEEYKAYTLARLGVGRNPDAKTAAKASTLITEEADLDRRPIVYRANNLPKGLPKWFEELDTNKDGQVALYEWRLGKMSMEDFKLWDRNDDGFITIEEAMRFSGTALAGADKTSTSPGTAGPGPSTGTPAFNGFFPGGNGEGKGKRGFNWGKRNQ